MQFKHLPILALASLIAAQDGNAPKDLATTLSSAENLSTLTSLVTANPALLEALGAAQNITILAPSNEAFEKLLSSPAGEGITDDAGLVAAILQYHVLNATVMAADISETAAFVPTLLTNETYTNVTGGQVIKAQVVGEDVVIYSGLGMNATVSQADIAFSGGIIHILDTVLTLPISVTETALASNLTALYGAVNATGLIDTVNETPDVTIFAPTNEAFQAIASGLQNATIEDLTSILTYHVVAGTVGYSSSLEDGMTLETANGASLKITISDGKVFVNAAEVVLADVLVANGVVHVIDHVLNPSATAGPSPSATEGAPAFTGASSISGGVPFTSGQPTPTMGGGEASSTSSVMEATGAAAPMATGAVGVAALFGAGVAVLGGY